MAESGNGCSSSGKRKWPGEGCGQEFPGDPPTDAEDTLPGEFVGVITEVPTCLEADTSQISWTFRGVTIRIAVEIKKFNGKVNEGFYTTIGEPEDLEVRRFVAAIVHDLVRLFWDPEYPVESLNINSVEFWIRKRKDLPLGCVIGKPLLDKFVLANRATLPHVPPDGWVGLNKQELGKLKDWIKDRGLVFWKKLEEDIMDFLKDHCSCFELSQGGRLREEAKQIPAAIKEDLETDLDQLNLNEQITSLKAKHAALEDENKSLKETKEKDDATITSLEAENKSLKETMEENDATITSLEAENKSLKETKEENDATITSLEAENKSLKETKEENDATITSLMLILSDSLAPESNRILNTNKGLKAESEAMGDHVKDLQHQLEKGRGGCLYYTNLPRSPTTGLMPRHDQESLQDDD